MLNDSLPDEELCPTIFAHIARKQLAEAAELVGQESARHAPRYYNYLDGHYRSIRPFLLPFLHYISFVGASAARSVLEAWRFLCRLDHQRPAPDLQSAPHDVVPNAVWQAAVFTPEKHIDRRCYIFCVLRQLVEGLQRRDLFVAPSRRWQDQRLQLLHGDA